METNLSSLKKTARLAGLLYLILGITSAYGLTYFPSQPIFSDDVATITNNILINEFSFRTQIVSNLISAIMFIFLAPVLYRLFKKVNEHHAKLLVGFMIVQVPIIFLLETFNFTALMILNGEIMKSLEPGKAQDLTVLFLTTNKCGIIILEIFWGLWLIPFGQLVYKSLFIPKIFGLFLFLGGMAYIIESSTILLFPSYKAFISPYVFVFYALGEFSIILWLLVKGVKREQLQTS